MVNNCAFVGQKNFDIIEMHGATTKIIQKNIKSIICPIGADIQPEWPLFLSHCSRWQYCLCN
jgi:hypothetical protein